ncbi:MAG: PLP-dependent cysteine synthase family protein [Pseudomonadota bacterium]
MRGWVSEAVAKIEADYQRSADTHLFKLPIGFSNGIDIYLKDESTHPTGSLKHRLARSLFLYALCNGKLQEGMPIIEASSGSTAVSEAYFAQLIGSPFIAVVPRTTARSKIDFIARFGGECHFVDHASEMHGAATLLAAEKGGHFMDQFLYAERATDWRGNNNIAESIFHQMERERFPVPRSIVMSAGTGGTSATIGRYIRYKGYCTNLIVVDPEYSAFFEGYTNDDPGVTTDRSSRIEGIGRPRVEKSFQPGVIDGMLKVPDAASIATMLWLHDLVGRRAGPSTGTNLFGALEIAKQMSEAGDTGSIVTLMCDGGDRYLDTYYNPVWVCETIGDIEGFTNDISRHPLVV